MKYHMTPCGDKIVLLQPVDGESPALQVVPLEHFKASEANAKHGEEMYIAMRDRCAKAEAQLAQAQQEVAAKEEWASLAVERLRNRLADETAIVDRIWDIYGRPSYEELAGKTIYDLINADRKALQEAQETIAKLTKPVTDEEWEGWLKCTPEGYTRRTYVDALLASRQNREGQ